MTRLSRSRTFLALLVLSSLLANGAIAVDEPLRVEGRVLLADFGIVGVALGVECDPAAPTNGVDTVWVDVRGRGGQPFELWPEPGLNLIIEAYGQGCAFLGGHNSGGAGAPERGRLPASTEFVLVIGYAHGPRTYPGPGGEFVLTVG